jgi:peroxiredoxin
MNISRILATLLASVLLTACGEQAPQLEKGQAAPGFTLAALNGSPLSLPRDLQGKIVAVRFWADWCPFCESEMQAIEPVYRQYQDQGLRILAVNVRQDRATAQAFIDKLDISYEVLLDEHGEVARQYGVIGLPTTFFVDRQGRLGTRILGESTPEVFEGIVKELL